MIEFKGHFDGRVVVPDEPVQLRAGERLVVRVEPEQSQERKRFMTAGELAASAITGIWADRTDITDSTEFSRELRRKIERRGALMLLLDTDVVIEVLRGRPNALAWLGSLSGQPIALSGYVVMEVNGGVRDLKELRMVERVLAPYPVIWLSAQGCDAALAVHRRLHLSHNTGIIDALIGQTAIEQGVPLHTFNVKHYAPIPRLTTIQPYIR